MACHVIIVVKRKWRCQQFKREHHQISQLHADVGIAFVCEADLWLAPTDGGVARRLTVSDLDVGAPRFSPDGAWLAFVGTDEGSPEVYVVPALGDQPPDRRIVPCQPRPTGLKLTGHYQGGKR